MTDTADPEAEFVPSPHALRRIIDACGNEAAATTMLLEWVKAGELSAQVTTYRVAWEGGPIITEKDKYLGVEDWDRFENVEPSAFKSGIVTTSGWDSFARNTVTVRMTGLRLQERGLAILLRTLPPKRETIMPDLAAIVDDKSEWVSTRDAVSRIMRATAQGASASLAAIVAYAKTGDIRARALVLTEDTHRQGASKDTHETRDAPIPLWFWDDFTTRGWANFNWQSGVFTGRGFRGANQVTVTLTGVQFDARGLDLLDPDPKQEAAGRAPRAGRPAADWWDDLLIEMFRKLWEDKWSPRTQAELVEAMHEWLSQNPGDDPSKVRQAGDTALKERARKLFQGLDLGHK